MSKLGEVFCLCDACVVAVILTSHVEMLCALLKSKQRVCIKPL